MTIQTSINANTFFPFLKILGGTGVNTPTTVATSGEYAAWDVNKNLAFNNYLSGYTTTATSSGTTILNVTSTYQQFFTGTASHTVVMPVVSTLVLGMTWRIVNLSTGIVTINSSGGNLIVNLNSNAEANLTVISLSGTTAASWQSDYNPNAPAVDSITGTPNQVIASSSTGAVTLSLPQNIATASSPTFAALTLTNPHILGAGGLISFQFFSTGTGLTYTRPSGVRSILVEVVGAGGGGGGSTGGASAISAGGPGAAGGYAALWVPTAATTYTYTVGAGGSGAPVGNNNGQTGGTTTFSAGAGLQATGGSGGLGMASTPNAQSNRTFPVAGGVGSNGHINISGAPSSGSFVALSNVFPGTGGSSHYGGGGITTVTGPGNPGGNYGSGGSGGVSLNTSFAGGNGSGGCILVWEFC